MPSTYRGLASSEEYAFDIPRPGWAEQDPEVWFQASINTIRRAIEDSSIQPKKVAGLGFTGLMHGPVFLDSQGMSLRPSIIWADQRTRDEVAYVYRTVGEEKIRQWTGNPLATGFMLPTWLWVKRHEKETFEKITHLLLPKDYLRYRFTGSIGTEHSDASATSIYDPFECQWNKDLLDHFTLSQDALPSISNSCEIAGSVLPKISGLTGLTAGTPVVFGGSDQACQAIGNGIIQPGLVSCTIGTGGQLFSVIQNPRSDPSLRIHLFRHAVPKLWHLLAATLTAGKSLRWLRDEIFPGFGYQELVNAAIKIEPGAKGLIFLPYLAGERTPHMDPDAAGAFLGLTLQHTKAHMIRAVLEGVVMSLKQGFEIISETLYESGITVKAILASGGASKHPLWLQLQADIFNLPMYQTGVKESAAFGAALLAGVGSGVFNDLHTICQKAVHWNNSFIKPNQQNQLIYLDKYKRFKNLYPITKPDHIQILR
jgi:xylulokinase